MRLRPVVAAFALAGVPALFAAEPAARSGIDPTHADPAVRIQDDLFRHVNGKWLRTAEIPADKSTDGAFIGLRDLSEQRVRAIVEATDQAAGDADAAKIDALYKSFMDEARADALGLAPIQAELDAVAKVTDKAGLIRTMAALQRSGVPGLFNPFIGPDSRKSDTNVTYLSQGGLGLPDEAYYRDAKYEPLRKAYVAHIGRLLALANVPGADTAGAKILALETAVAKGHWDNVRSRDADKTYNKVSRDQLRVVAKGIDIDGWLEAAGLKDIGEVIVRQPDYLTRLGETLGAIPIDDWKLYLTWRVVSTRAPFLSAALVAERFNFADKTLQGTPQNPPRWKRGVEVVERALGEAVGRLYVTKHFPPAAREKMTVLVANLIEAYRIDIQALDWMTPETKVKALEKLAKFTPRIGHPEKWRDYSKLEIQADDLVGNVRRTAEFTWNRHLAKLGKPVDRGEWNMTPQTVNAYYSPTKNEIVFPAAILQPPFFDLDADDAVNYGGIGAVIGHEIGHGFDDQGSKYDGDGNLKNWWSLKDRSEFDIRTKRLIEQYNAFSPPQLPGSHVNGALTVGENIGDLGGLTIAHKAYMLSLKGKDAPVIDGRTGPQRFFIGWAQVWRSKYRDPALERMLATNPHSPGEFRCNGTVRNLAEFHEAFGTKEGDALWLPPAQRVRIW